MRKVYHRVETIERIVVTDSVVVTDDKVERLGLPENEAATMTVEWKTVNGDVLPESSAIYHFLETEFQKLPMDDD